jgi:hypothetical protein
LARSTELPIFTFLRFLNILQDELGGDRSGELPEGHGLVLEVDQQFDPAPVATPGLGQSRHLGTVVNRPITNRAEQSEEKRVFGTGDSRHHEGFERL